MRQVLDQAARGGVDVLHVPPGEGKTSVAIRELLRRIHSGELTRILWAVKDTTRAGGLAAQAQQQFAAEAASLGLPERPWSRIILGRTAFEASTSLSGAAVGQAYKTQHAWDVPVLIISHAHLPLVLAPRPPKILAGLRRAQFMVVDEDPCRSLVLTEASMTDDSLRAPDVPALLTALVSAGLTTAARSTSVLAQLAAPDVLAGCVKVLVNPARGNRITGYEMTGREVLRIMGELLEGAAPDEAAWRRFVFTLAGQLDAHATSDACPTPVARKYAGVLVKGLRQELDLRGVPEASNRFGFVWKMHGGHVRPPRLRFALPRPLEPPCPVVVLDAYAHAAMYTRAFTPLPVAMHVLPAQRPLEVLVAPHLRRDRADLLRGRGQTQLDVIVQELALFASESRRGTLFVLPKSERDGMYGTALRAALTAGGVPSDRWAMLHWRSGRGINHFCGWDVVALTPLKLPAEHRDRFLAAWSDDPRERRAWHHHEEIAELFQVLHRSRQPQADPREAPRLLMTFLPCVLCPVDVQQRCTPADGPMSESCTTYVPWNVRFMPYAGRLRIRPGAWYPKREQLFHEAAQVVLDGAGGVPLLAFEALGLAVTNAGGRRRRQDLFHAGRAVRTWAEAGQGSEWPAWARGVGWEIQEGETLDLWRARLEGERGALRITAERDNNRERLREVLTDLNLREWRVRAGAQNPYSVYAREEEEARAALTRLLSPPFAGDMG